MATKTYTGNHDFSGATLTGIGSQTYDAVVATSGGDYTTLGAAITGGATSIFIRDGTYNETGDITLPSNCTLIGESEDAVVNMGTNLMTIGAWNTLFNFKLQSERDGNQFIIGGGFVHIARMFFVQARTSNPTALCGVISDNNVARNRIWISESWIDLTPSSANYPNLCAIYIQSTSSNAWFISDMTFTGSTLFQSKQILCNGVHNSFDSFVFLNIGADTFDTIEINGDNNTLNNWTFSGSNCVIAITGDYTTIANLTADSGNVELNIDSTGNSVSACSSQGDLVIGTSGTHNQISACKFRGGVSISGDDNTISGSSVGVDAGGGANTITVVAGADRTIINNCRVDADVSDAGTDTVASYVIY